MTPFMFSAQALATPTAGILPAPQETPASTQGTIQSGVERLSKATEDNDKQDVLESVGAEDAPRKPQRFTKGGIPPKTRLLLERNAFNVTRTLGEYNQLFGTSLRKSLRQLKEDGAWVDMGAGSAAAQRMLLRRLQKNGASHRAPEFIAVGYKIPEAFRMAVQQAKKSSHGKFIYIEGNQNPATIRAMPPVDLITDISGIYTYSAGARLSVLKAYVSILKPGGAIFIDTLFDPAIKSWLNKQKNLSHEVAQSWQYEMGMQDTGTVIRKGGKQGAHRESREGLRGNQ